MEKKIQILATTDIHGWFVPYDFGLDQESAAGGITCLAAQIRKLKGENKNTILADCGDTVQANYAELFCSEELYTSEDPKAFTHPLIHALNYLAYDVWTFGNHEYNFDPSWRELFVEQFHGTTLCGNVYLEGQDHSVLPATTVIERDGIRVGFIGMTTPLIKEFEERSHTLDGFCVFNPLDVVGEAITALKAQGVHCIVGLIHEGFDLENNTPGTSVVELAKQFPEFDVIIGGHEHKEYAYKMVNGILLCQPGVNAHCMSGIDLTFVYEDGSYHLTEKVATLYILREKSGEAEMADSHIVSIPGEEDPVLKQQLEPYKARLVQYVNRSIGFLEQEPLFVKRLQADIPGIYTQSSGIMNLLGASSMYYSGAECTILGTDNPEPGFDVGEVKRKHICSSYTYTGGEITVYAMTGAQLTRLLEWDAAYFQTMEDGASVIKREPSRMTSKYCTYYIGSGLYYEIDLRKDQGRIRNLSLLETDSRRIPLRREDGTLILHPIADSQIIKVGTNAYKMNQWCTRGGCLEDETIPVLSSTFTEMGEAGRVRDMAISYVIDVLGGKIDGREFNFQNWKLIY